MVRQKEKDSHQKEKPHGKKKKTQSKKKTSWQNFFDTERTFLFLLLCGRGYSFFFREVILFALRLFFLPWGFSFCREVNSFAVTVVGHHTVWNSVPEDSWFFNMWVFVRTSTNFAHLTSFQAIEFMDWPVPKTLDISLCQTSQNAAFCNCCSSVVCGEEREHDLISSPVSTFSAKSA